MVMEASATIPSNTIQTILYSIKNKAAISLPLNYTVKAIAALFFIHYFCPI